MHPLANPTPRTLVPKTLVLASVLATLAVGTSRADSIWIANPLTPSSFGLGANWDTAGQPVVPSTADIAFIANGGTATVADGDIFTILGLQIDSGAVIQTGGTLDSSASTTNTIFNVGTTASTGSFTASGSSILNLGTTRIGQNGGTGTVTLSGTSIYNGINNGDTWLGDQVGSTGTLNLQEDSQWIIGNNALVVGRGGGAGTLNMSGNASLTQAGNNTYLGGDQADSTSTVNMSGFSKLTNTAGDIWIGQNQSTAVVNLTDDAVIEATNSWIAIGREGSTSTVTLSDRSKLLKSGGGGNIEISSAGGAAGVGTLIAQGNSTVQTNNSIHIGVRGGSNGVFTVKDNATVDVGSEIWISNEGGTGVMNQEGGSVTLNNWFAVGRDNGNGTFNISGGTFTKNGNGNITTSALGAAPTSVINQTGGAIVVNSGEVWIHESGTGTSTWTATGGTGTFLAAINIHQGAGGSSSLNIGGNAVYTAPVMRNKTNGTLNLSGNGSLTLSDTYYASGGTTNFTGGAFSVPQIIIDNGTNVMSFGGGTQNIGKITLNASTVLDTVTQYVIKAGQTIAGTGNAAMRVERSMKTTDGTSVVSMADGATSSTGNLTFATGLDASAGATVSLDVNGATTRADRIIAFNLNLGNTINLQLNNLHLGSMVENTFYTISLFSGNLDEGDWFNTAIFNFVTDGTIAVDTAFGNNGVNFDPNNKVLQVRIASVQPVPEPSTIAMFALGLPAAMLVLRRKRA